MRFETPFGNIFIFFSLSLILILPTKAFSSNCNQAYQKFVAQGPLDEAEITAKMRCVYEVPISRRESKFIYVCVFTGQAKKEAREKYGAGDLAIISAEDAESEKGYSGLIGEWYNFKGPLRGQGSGVEDVLVTGTAIGSKVLRKTYKDETPTLAKVEKIQISLPEKILSYEKSLKTRTSSRVLKTRIYHCEKFEPEDPNAGKDLDKDGLPIRKGISSRARKTPVTNSSKAASGISGVK